MSDAESNQPIATPRGQAALLGPAEVRALAEEFGVRPTKQLGQNFVHDANTVRRIVTTAGVTRDDVVLEVGPGLGSLTMALMDVVDRVIAVEIDPNLAARLPKTVSERAPELADRLTVVEADAMRVLPSQIPGEPTALVANLPYNVAVPVLLHLFASLPSLRTALVMVQAEVADRLAADPGSKIYGVPSVKANFFGEVRRAAPWDAMCSGRRPRWSPVWYGSTVTSSRRGRWTSSTASVFLPRSTQLLLSVARPCEQHSVVGRVRRLKRSAGSLLPESSRRRVARCSTQRRLCVWQESNNPVRLSGSHRYQKAHRRRRPLT